MTTPKDRLNTEESISQFLYYSLNLLCFYLIVSRAMSMPIQGDEAGTYLRHATTGVDGLFNLSTANNHFLNTFLIAVATSKAPFSEVAIRIPVILTYAWFFLFYIPLKFCFPKWTDKLLFACGCLLPYYFNEYASMARGYVMSACFACAAFNEAALFEESQSSQYAFNSDRLVGTSDKHRLARVLMFTSLATLSSILVFPLMFLVSFYGFVHFRWFSSSRHSWQVSPSINAAIALTLGTLVLTFYTFLSIKGTGVATIVSPPLPFDSWFIGLSTLLWAPVAAVAHANGSSTPIFSQIIVATLTISIVYATLFRGSQQHLRILILLIAFNFFVLYMLALVGSYPTGRGWLPFWPIIIFSILCAKQMAFDGFLVKVFPPNLIRWFSVSSLTALTLISISSVWHSYNGNYVYELRPFYYQYKSLMHYSRTQSLQCLSYGDINDEVLKFYFLNPVGPVPMPTSCAPGVQSQRGFMQFSYDNKEPFFD
jgi:hypothetical protein